MKRIIRIILLVIGAIVGLFGAFKDYEPVTFIGATLFIVGLMLPVVVNTFKI